MKFCENCGKQLLEDAVVCTGCGCSVMPLPINTARVPKDLGPKEPFHSKQSVTAIVLAGIGIAWPILGVLFGVLFNLLLGGFFGSSLSALLDAACIVLSIIGLVSAVKARKRRNTDTLAFIAIFVAIAGILVSIIGTLINLISVVICLIPLIFLAIYIIIYILIIVFCLFIALLAV